MLNPIVCMGSVQQLQAKQAAQHYTYKAHTSHATSAVALLLLLSSPLLSSPLLPPQIPLLFLGAAAAARSHERLATSGSPPRSDFDRPAADEFVETRPRRTCPTVLDLVVAFWFWYLAPWTYL